MKDIKQADDKPTRFANAHLDEDLAKRFDTFCRRKMVRRSDMVRLGITLVLGLKELPGLEPKK
jgi:hypothetical protein